MIDSAVTNAGYQGPPAPDQWFGGPAPSASAGNMVLRDTHGLLADSLNYGSLVDPWLAEGYQGKSGSGQAGCTVTAPGTASGAGRSASRHRQQLHRFREDQPSHARWGQPPVISISRPRC